MPDDYGSDPDQARTAPHGATRRRPPLYNHRLRHARPPSITPAPNATSRDGAADRRASFTPTCDHKDKRHGTDRSRQEHPAHPQNRMAGDRRRDRQRAVALHGLHPDPGRHRTAGAGAAVRHLRHRPGARGRQLCRGRGDGVRDGVDHRRAGADVRRREEFRPLAAAHCLFVHGGMGGGDLPPDSVHRRHPRASPPRSTRSTRSISASR